MRFLMEKNEIKNSDIKKIFIHQPSYFAENFIAYPPATSVDTASSLKYLVGALLFTRNISTKWYENFKEILENKEFQELTEKIEIIKDDRLQAIFENEKVVKGKVVIETNEKSYEKEMELEDLKGNPRNNPMSMEEIREKFLNLSERAIGKEKAYKFLGLLDEAEHGMKIKEFVKCLTN